MERARATWTDERLDDLAHRVDLGFGRVDDDLRSLRVELSARLDGLEGRIDAQGTEVSRRIDGLDARFDALQRTLLQLGGGMIATFAVGFAGLIATQL